MDQYTAAREQAEQAYGAYVAARQDLDQATRTFAVTASFGTLAALRIAALRREQAEAARDAAWLAWGAALDVAATVALCGPACAWCGRRTKSAMHPVYISRYDTATTDVCGACHEDIAALAHDAEVA